MEANQAYKSFQKIYVKLETRLTELEAALFASPTSYSPNQQSSLAKAKEVFYLSERLIKLVEECQQENR